MKLTERVLRLIAKVTNSEGWAPTSDAVHGLLKKDFPQELIELRDKTNAE